MELFSESTRRDPWPLYAALRASAPVLHLPEQQLWVLLTYDGVKRALHDVEAFSSNVSATRGEQFEWLLFMDPPRHTELRTIVSRAFTSRSIAALEPRIRELSRALLDAAGERFDLVADYATPLPMMVIAEMLGLPVDDWRRYARWSEAIVGLGNTIAGGDAEAAATAFDAADRELSEVLARAVADTRGDTLLRRLVDAELGEREIVRFTELLLAAGTETTTNTIANAVVALADYPDQRAAAMGDVPRAVEEVVRYRSPVQAMFRATRKPIEIAGTTIPADQLVVACIGAANRDPAQFAQPDRFDVTRDPNPHVAFGHGVHFCIGAPLARLEARIALADLLARPLVVETPHWQPRGAFHVHGPRSLVVSAGDACG